VLAQALRLAGIWMGRWRSPRTEDALAPRYFLQRHFEQALAPNAGQCPALQRAFRRMMRAHRFGLTDPRAPWGWKNPRSMWLIPFLASLFPSMFFVHLVRDGRDLALSDNRNLLRKHGARLLGETAELRDPLAAQLRLWSLGNRRAAADGQHWLGERYLSVSYEHFCTQPYDTLAQLYRQLGQAVDEARIDQGARLVRRPASLGAWRNSEARIVHQPPQEVTEALQQFGYA
jgi:hypothetical protein